MKAPFWNSKLWIQVNHHEKNLINPSLKPAGWLPVLPISPHKVSTAEIKDNQLLWAASQQIIAASEPINKMYSKNEPDF